MAEKGWHYLTIRSAEGSHAPENAEISEEDYEAAREAVRKGLDARRYEMLTRIK